MSALLLLLLLLFDYFAFWGGGGVGIFLVWGVPGDSIDQNIL